MLYLRLFHGRTDPEQEMDDWGSDGPVFGPYKFVHTTYGALLRLGRKDGDCDELHVHENLLFYDDVYYGDWSVFTEDIFKISEYKAVKYDPIKARIPAHS